MGTPLLRISGTAGRVVLKLGVLSRNHTPIFTTIRPAVRPSIRPAAIYAFYTGWGCPNERTCNYAHTFKHICSLPLVHRPKGVLLVKVQMLSNCIQENSSDNPPVYRYANFAQENVLAPVINASAPHIVFCTAYCLPRYAMLC